MHAAAALKPCTDVNVVTSFVGKLHMVLVMTVEPGKKFLYGVDTISPLVILVF
jgi:pentose-5-phosphate-3-epimerase